MKGKYVYIGGAGLIYALDRATGSIVWEVELKTGWIKSGKDFVSLVEGLDHIYAVSYGIVFAIDKMSGRILWQNELKRLKHEIATLTVDGAAVAALLATREASLAVEADGGDGGNGNGD
jgi:outer membrane protein assembly factor BamB